MKLRYKVTEENYIEMLQMQLKRKNRSFLSLLITFLCTFGQMGVLIYMIASGAVAGKHIYILGAMSIAIFVLNIVYRLTTHRRAVVALERFKLQGKLTAAAIPSAFTTGHIVLNYMRHGYRIGSAETCQQ